MEINPCPCGYHGELAGMNHQGIYFSLACPECKREATAFTMEGLIEAWNKPAPVEEYVLSDRPGYDALWLSFGMSRAAFVALPRVMMHDMPDAWQADMARLLDEWEDTWVNQPNISSRVQIVDADGRLMKTPGWLLNYRHPDREQLAVMRLPKKVALAGEEGSE